jgi:hypothetical protein
MTAEPIKHVHVGPYQRAVDALMTYWLNGCATESEEGEAMRAWWETEAVRSAQEIVRLVSCEMEDPDDIVECPCGQWMRRRDAITTDIEEPLLCAECSQMCHDEGSVIDRCVNCGLGSAAHPDGRCPIGGES